MAILILGDTRCALCSRVIMTRDGVVSFPPLTTDPTDPVFAFGDGAFHLSCIKAHPTGDSALRRLAVLLTALPPASRTCEVCGLPLSDPDEDLVLGILSEELPLSRFNNVGVHGSCVELWVEERQLRDLLQGQVSTDRAAAWLIARLDRSRQRPDRP